MTWNRELQGSGHTSLLQVVALQEDNDVPSFAAAAAARSAHAADRLVVENMQAADAE
jgi:hypothetical protein